MHSGAQNARISHHYIRAGAHYVSHVLACQSMHTAYKQMYCTLLSSAMCVCEGGHVEKNRVCSRSPSAVPLDSVSQQTPNTSCFVHEQRCPSCLNLQTVYLSFPPNKPDTYYGDILHEHTEDVT